MAIKTVDVPLAGPNYAPLGIVPLGPVQVVPFTSGASAQSAPMGAGTVGVQLYTPETVHVAVGADPEAGTADWPIVAGYASFAVQPGQKVALIGASASASGTAYLMEIVAG